MRFEMASGGRTSKSAPGGGGGTPPSRNLKEVGFRECLYTQETRNESPVLSGTPLRMKMADPARTTSTTDLILMNTSFKHLLASALLSLGVGIICLAPAAENPVLVGTWPGIPRGNAMAVAVFGTYAYVADDETGLLVIDVSKPVAPVQVSRYLTSAEALPPVI